MDGATSTLFIIAVIVVSMVGLMGLGLLFVRATKIERNVLVGGCTLASAILAGALLSYFVNSARALSAENFVSVIMVSLLGFGLGWLFDRIAGPATHQLEDRQATLGADLSD